MAAPRSNPITTPMIVPAWLWLVLEGVDAEVADAFCVDVEVAGAEEVDDKVLDDARADDVVVEEEDEDEDVVGYSSRMHSLLTQE